MARNAKYPPADCSQWYGSGNAFVPPTKTLWHTTETPGGWPGYQAGAVAPGSTLEPWAHAWRQHFPVGGTSRALKNGPSYSTNRMGVDQIEVSCYCDPAVLSRTVGRAMQDAGAPVGSIARVLETFASIDFPDDPDLQAIVLECLDRSHVRSLMPDASMRVLSVAAARHVSKLDQQAYDMMAARAEWMLTEWGVPMTLGVPVKPYPASYGPNNGVRLSAGAFASYSGHLAHEHAPYNDHGDSGSLDITRIVASGGAAPAQPTKETDMYVVAQPERGVWLMGAGFAHWLNPDEWAQLKQYSVDTGKLPFIQIPGGGAGPAVFDLYYGIHTSRTTRALTRVAVTARRLTGRTVPTDAVAA